jgi:acetyl-CoA carboxylase biotin carboxyl carrier protein
MTEVRAEITANVWQVPAQVGAQVSAGQELVILESMKMEIPVEAPSDGTVTAVHVQPDDQVTEGALLVELEP